MLLYVDSNFLSPYAMSAFVALKTKGIEFELTTIDLNAKQNLSDDYFQTSITSRVPTLADGAFSLSESSAISEYLEEIKLNPNIFPTNLQNRAKARQIQAWLRSDLLALRQDRTTEVIFYAPTSKELTPQGRLASEKLIRVASLILNDGRIHLFESWSIADTDLALMLNRLILNGDNVPELLKKYAAFQWQNPYVQEWVSIKRPSIK